MKFRAGDIVDHKPSDERWILATDEEYGQVLPLGWPESIAKAADCTLVKASSDEERISMLIQSAKLPSSDVRGRTAKRQIVEKLP
jgi:hypothetical protein